MEEQSERRTHGAAIPKWKERQICLFDSTGKCVIENAAEFSKLIASEVKDPRLIPLKRDWRLVPEDDKEVLWERIKVYIFSFVLLYFKMIFWICTNMFVFYEYRGISFFLMKIMTEFH